MIAIKRKKLTTLPILKYLKIIKIKKASDIIIFVLTFSIKTDSKKKIAKKDNKKKTGIIKKVLGSIK